jgi:hypothetical protein
MMLWTITLCVCKAKFVDWPIGKISYKRAGKAEHSICQLKSRKHAQNVNILGLLRLTNDTNCAEIT